MNAPHILSTWQQDESAYLWLKKAHPKITTLDLANGTITTLECLQHPQWKTLETLVLDYNDIEGIGKCPPLPALTALSLNGNNIDELDDLLDDITNKFPRLRFLSLLDNPCCPALHAGIDKNHLHALHPTYVCKRGHFYLGGGYSQTTFWHSPQL